MVVGGALAASRSVHSVMIWQMMIAMHFNRRLKIDARSSMK
jgi:hypothetical protein